MTTSIKPLAITPRPKKGESLKGFILRTSEDNGYRTPSMMLSTAGMTSGDIYRNVPPIEKLIPLYGRNENEFESLGYKYEIHSRNSNLVPIRHSQIPSIYLSGKKPKICPECILENGCIDAFWDLKYAVACPVHSRASIQKCPYCGDNLHWFRPGLLTCRCESDLSKIRGEDFEHLPTLGLLGLLRSKLLDEPLDYELLKSRLGFAVDHLEQMSFNCLLGVIGRFEGRESNSNHCKYPHRKHNLVNNVLSRAANALANWPKGLYEHLELLDNEGKTQDGFGLRTQFKSFYESFFKAGLPAHEVGFVKDAFIRFGKEKWKKAYITDELDRGLGHGKKLVGIYKLADVLGVMPSTAKKIVMKEHIPSVTVTYNGRTRQLFDVDQALPYKPSAGSSLTLREAARRLDLPVSVLTVLRSKKAYEVKHICNLPETYHEKDVIEFHNMLMAKCPNNNLEISDSHISLNQVMQKKTGSSEIKAAFIIALIKGDVFPLGKTEDAVGKVVFSKPAVEQLLRKLQSEHFGHTTVAAAAKLLSSDPLVVKNLYLNGLLNGEETPRGLYILESSIEEFSKQYISCVAIALKLGVSTYQATKRCEALKIEIQWFPRVVNQSSQPFINSKDAEMQFNSKW